MKKRFIFNIFMSSTMSTAFCIPLASLTSCSKVSIEIEEKHKDSNEYGYSLFLFKLSQKIDDNQKISIGAHNMISKSAEIKVVGVAKPIGEDENGYALLKFVPLAGHQLVDGDIVTFDLEFRCIDGNSRMIWRCIVNGLSVTYDATKKDQDDDFDGLVNCIDPQPENNHYNGVVDFYSKQPISFDMDYRLFFQANPEKYNPELGKLGAILSADAASPSDVWLNNEIFTTGDDRFYNQIGCKDYLQIDLKKERETYQYDKNDTSYCNVAHHDLMYKNTGDETDKLYKIVFISFEGTSGNEEWMSDFDVGMDDAAYYEKVKPEGGTGTRADHPDWIRNTEKDAFHTKGVCVAMNRIIDHLEGDNGWFKKANIDLKNDNLIFFICGHSRGGAIANLLSAHYIDLLHTESYAGIKKLFGYCYASPNTTFDENAKDAKYNPIQNVVNDDDVVGKVPLKLWGISRYGQDNICYIGKDRNNKTKWEQNWSDLDDGNKHTYYFFPYFMENVDKIPVQIRKDIYDIDNPSQYQTFILNNKTYETETEVDYDISIYQTSLKWLNIKQYFNLKSVEKDSKFYIQCTNCGGGGVALANNFFSGEEVDLLQIIKILPLFSNYFDYAIPLAFNLLMAMAESDSPNYFNDMGNSCHSISTYYFCAENVFIPQPTNK